MRSLPLSAVLLHMAPPSLPVAIRVPSCFLPGCCHAGADRFCEAQQFVGDGVAPGFRQAAAGARAVVEGEVVFFAQGVFDERLGVQFRQVEQALYGRGRGLFQVERSQLAGAVLELAGQAGQQLEQAGHLLFPEAVPPAGAARQAHVGGGAGLAVESLGQAIAHQAGVVEEVG